MSMSRRMVWNLTALGNLVKLGMIGIFKYEGGKQA